jgi:hypothetical protein
VLGRAARDRAGLDGALPGRLLADRSPPRRALAGRPAGDHAHPLGWPTPTAVSRPETGQPPTADSSPTARATSACPAAERRAHQLPGDRSPVATVRDRSRGKLPTRRRRGRGLRPPSHRPLRPTTTATSNNTLQKGDTSNELRRGTFLKSFDSPRISGCLSRGRMLFLV